MIHMKELVSEVQVLAVEDAVTVAGFESFRTGTPNHVIVNVIDHELDKKPDQQTFASLDGVYRVAMIPVSRPTIPIVPPLAPSYV